MSRADDLVTMTCPLCDGDGAYDVMLAGSSRDEEPSYRREHCERCDGEGELEVPRWVAELIDESISRLVAENTMLRALRREKERTSDR